MRRPFVVRVFGPPLRQILRLFGSLAPKKSVQATERLLLQAGRPWGLSALDFFGLRLLATLVAGGLYSSSCETAWLFSPPAQQPPGRRRRFLHPVGVAALAQPGRQHEISRALPDALDMLTIGVEAGLAFESALLRVGERWHNALTYEFRRAVAEMRIGTPRDIALTRMAERSDVPELRAFVAILIQSSQLGVSIAQVLHTQAAEMRVKRRQRRRNWPGRRASRWCSHSFS